MINNFCPGNMGLKQRISRVLRKGQPSRTAVGAGYSFCLRNVLAGVLLSFASPALIANVYKCVDKSGKINYSDVKCSTDGGKMDLVPNIIVTDKAQALRDNNARTVQQNVNLDRLREEQQHTADEIARLRQEKDDLEAKKQAELANIQQQLGGMAGPDTSRLLAQTAQITDSYDKQIHDIDQQLSQLQGGSTAQ